MATRRWVEHAEQALRESLGPVPAELNELDWKAGLSPQRDRLVEHLIAMANLRSGGTLVLGIDNQGNALIHQDFSLTGSGPMIELFDDRIEFSNPGALLPGKRPDRLIGTTPESRNEQLASSFRRFRICEERGTGFQKVVQAIELYGLPPLQLRADESAFRVTLWAPRRFPDMDMAERIEACYQHAVLQYVSSRTLTNTTLRERFKLSEKQRNTVTNLIAAAVEAGRIRRKDAGSGNKFAEYLPYWA